MQSFTVAVCVALLTPWSSIAAQVRDSVWVNTRSKVYHCPGTAYFGRTTRGEYLSEEDARRRGARPNGGKQCTATAAPRALLSASEEVAVPEPAMPVGQTMACTLVSITDGDTINCGSAGRIRLIGIDTPESNQDAYHTAATAALAAWLPHGAALTLERDSTEHDQYGRRLAYVWFEGRMVNWLMVRYGWALSNRYPPDERHLPSLEAAESLARKEGRGLWRVNGLSCEATRRRRAC